MLRLACHWPLLSLFELRTYFTEFCIAIKIHTYICIFYVWHCSYAWHPPFPFCLLLFTIILLFLLVWWLHRMYRFSPEVSVSAGAGHTFKNKYLFLFQYWHVSGNPFGSLVILNKLSSGIFWYILLIILSTAFAGWIKSRTQNEALESYKGRIKHYSYL